MSVNVHIIFYSLYGHTYQLAKSIAEGANSVSGVEAKLFQVRETLDAKTIEKMGATDAKKAFADVPIADPADLDQADALIFGSGTRFGSATAQLQSFFDATGSHWKKGTLVGKAGGVFTSSGTQHGGQETTLISMQTFLFHQGMVVVGVPYAAEELLNMKEITGGSPYGSSTITDSDGSRMPSANELAIARFQGSHTAKIAKKLRQS